MKELRNVRLIAMQRIHSERYEMKRLITLLLVFALFVSVMLTACSGSDPAKTPEETITDTPSSTTMPSSTAAEQTTLETTPAPTTTEAEVVPPGAEYLFDKRVPIALMINNTANARPQSGLGQAKLIYQMMTEARTTRLLMFTDVEEGVLGPVRSARPAYLDLVTQYKALYTYAGNGRVIDASPVNHLIRRVDALGAAGRLFYRMSHRVAPHNLYIKAESIYSFSEKRAPVELSEPLPGLMIRDAFVQPDGGEKAVRIDYQFKKPAESFRYNESEKKYFKYNGDTVLVDEITKKKVGVGNVFLINVPHGTMPNGVHVKIDWVSSGKALYFTGGQKYDVTWSKKSHSAPMVFKLNGETLVLNPGLTWIVVMDGQASKTVAYK
jgi:hypothetical protein